MKNVSFIASVITIIAMVLVGYIVWLNYNSNKKERCKDATCFSEQAVLLREIKVQLEKNNKLIRVALMQGISENERDRILRILDE